LLSREVLIYENLTNLAAVVGRTGQFIGLPIKVAGGSGAPVRAVAVV
jgi:kynurenine formamidase